MTPRRYQCRTIETLSSFDEPFNLVAEPELGEFNGEKFKHSAKTGSFGSAITSQMKSDF